MTKHATISEILRLDDCAKSADKPFASMDWLSIMTTAAPELARDLERLARELREHDDRGSAWEIANELAAKWGID